MAKKNPPLKKQPDFSKLSIDELLAAMIKQLEANPVPVDSRLQEAFVKKLEALEKVKPQLAAERTKQYQDALGQAAQAMRERARRLREKAEALQRKRERKTRPRKRPRKKPR